MEDFAVSTTARLLLAIPALGTGLALSHPAAAQWHHGYYGGRGWHHGYGYGHRRGPGFGVGLAASAPTTAPAAAGGLPARLLPAVLTERREGVPMTDAVIDVGSQAPAFRMPASRGREVASDALEGHPYLLYFYPKADTPGCTTQACGMEEALPQLKDVGVTVIGVSPDPMGPIDKFAEKFNLTFPLASDADHSLALAYGCWGEKKMYGKTYLGILRSSFLVDGAGVVRAVWRNVKPEAHASDVKAAAAAL